MTRRTRLFIAALGAIVLAVVAFDVIGPWGGSLPAAPVSVAPAAPEVRRGLNKTPLLYPAEFAAELSQQVAVSFVTVESSGPNGAQLSRGAAVAPHQVVTAPLAAGDRWRVTHLEGHAHDVIAVATDAVHGVALLTLGGAPLTPLPVAADAAALDEPVLLLDVGADVRVPFPVVIDPPLDFNRLEDRLRAFPRGTVAVSLEAALLGLAASGAESVRPLAAPLLTEIISALRTSGRHPHPWTGVEVQEIDGPLRKRFPGGALVVVHVAAGSPAPRELAPGVVLSEVRAGTVRATTEPAVQRLIASSRAVSYVRQDGRAFDVRVIDRQLPLEFAPEGSGASVDAGAPRLTVAPMSRAAGQGLRTADIVRAIDLRPVRSPAQVEAAMSGTRDRLLTVQRGERWRFILWTVQTPERRP